MVQQSTGPDRPADAGVGPQVTTTLDRLNQIATVHIPQALEAFRELDLEQLDQGQLEQLLTAFSDVARAGQRVEHAQVDVELRLDSAHPDSEVLQSRGRTPQAGAGVPIEGAMASPTGLKGTDS